MSKESEKTEKRERSKESKERKVKESISHSLSARTREEMQRLAGSVPTLEQVKSYAHDCLGYTDDAFIEDWYRQMSMSFWCDQYGKPIRNWGWVFNKWRLSEKYFAKLRDPARIADMRSGKAGPARKADNWRGTRKEDLDDVLA